MRRHGADLSGKEGMTVEKEKNSNLIIVRGGGDLATGSIHRLWSAGFPVLVLESEYPAAIRRQVSVCEAVYEGETVVEGMRARRIGGAAEAWPVIRSGDVPVLTDPEGESIRLLGPAVVVDAILAKVNLGTDRSMAGLTIGLGPGFTAGRDVDFCIETRRGHNLGRIIRQGSAEPNTGIPGVIAGCGAERVIHAETAGTFRQVRQIGDLVRAGETVAVIETPDGDKCPVPAAIDGILRGILRDGYPVIKGFKLADVDPRAGELKNCFTISDKSRCIAGSVLELCVGFCYNGTYYRKSEGEQDADIQSICPGGKP